MPQLTFRSEPWRRCCRVFWHFVFDLSSPFLCLQVFTLLFTLVQPAPQSVMPLLSFRSETMEAVLPRFLAAVASWPVQCDPLRLLKLSPELLQVQ